jgi:hypothetical protein
MKIKAKFTNWCSYEMRLMFRWGVESLVISHFLFTSLIVLSGLERSIWFRKGKGESDYLNKIWSIFLSHWTKFSQSSLQRQIVSSTTQCLIPENSKWLFIVLYLHLINLMNYQVLLILFLDIFECVNSFQATTICHLDECKLFLTHFSHLCLLMLIFFFYCLFIYLYVYTMFGSSLPYPSPSLFLSHFQAESDFVDEKT